jgi:polysaccharide biosynthesis protein PslJ
VQQRSLTPAAHRIPALASPRFTPALAVLDAFVLIAILLPFAAIPLPGVGAIAVAQLALIAFHLAWLGQRGPVPAGWRALEIAGLGFIAVAAVAFGLGVAAYGYTREAGLAAFNLAVSALAAIGVMRVITSRDQLRAVMRVLLVTAGVAAGVGLVLWALPAATAERLLLLLVPIGYPDGPEVIRIVYGTQLERATGTSVDANLFGGLMMITTALVAAQLLARETLLPRPALLAIGLIAGAALVLTFSRSAWVGTGVALVYLGLVLERRALILVAVAVAVIIAVPQLRDRIGGAMTVQDAASVMRVEEYRTSVALIGAHPLLGVGFGPAMELDLVRRVSNMYLLIAEEMGLIGLAVLLGILGIVLRRAVRRVAPAEPDAGLTAGTQAALVGCLVAGLFDHYFMNSLFPHTSGLFWLLVGLLAVAARVSAAPAPPA